MTFPIERPDDLVVGMAGTFDVENYGDLLFPLIAGEALRQRDPRIKVLPFSIHARSKAAWPFEVMALDELSSILPSLSAMLIGGGQLVRFDARYPVPVPADMPMPIAYWLVPAVLAALAAKPVIWNAVGAWTDSPRAPEYDDLIRRLFSASGFIGVRDEASRDHLAGIAPDATVELLPDTAFGLSRLWPLEGESAEFSAWRRSAGLSRPYVVIQADRMLARHRGAIEAAMKTLDIAEAVILPVCRCHGDRGDAFPAPTTGAFAIAGWLPPRLISEIIGRSRFVFATSLHACITALSYGVPVARAERCSDRKFELLDGFEGIARIDDRATFERLLKRVPGIEPRVESCLARLDCHWDIVADTVLRPPVVQGAYARRIMLDAVTRGLGGRHRARPDRRLVSRLTRRVNDMGRKAMRISARVGSLARGGATALRRMVGDRDAPASTRQVDSASGEPSGNAEPILDLGRIAGHRLCGEPWHWAAIDRLFSAEQAASLAATFPTDRYKLVAGYDGEKGYRYKARSLIHMGASRPSYPDRLSPDWLSLASDLISPDYRVALSEATGVDLSSALMEANVIEYGPGSWLGPHVDLREKQLTHILYFNEAWDPANGGCLNILGSGDPDDKVAEIHPLIGNSALLIRSDNSWHSVSPVSDGIAIPRRSLNVIFHLPGSISTMWPPRARSRLHNLVSTR